ncbi:protein-glutamate O-methyltransferase CheR [Novosphingobium profundi]|uniref:CheR family methyltransferase n=1 Tax=Novosphingobium profundi TaxID=1774954 RepID=UPI001BD98E48|nr:protein-glutamate O-methyltransferase CheR [Novosphingobium profundi]MBT0671454.1 protein-glutamate O-methyltransferase CheR [Novosphingobium profundi]
MNNAAYLPFETHADEDHIAPAHFKALAALIHERTGIHLQPAKRTMLEGRLRRRARDTGQASLRDYCKWILSLDSDARELEHLVNAVTTNKTDFFREPRHFDYLTGTILPEMRDAGRHALRCWSAASSIGAEPYTIAMLLDAFARRNAGFEYAIVATDIDTRVLETARRGIYPRDMISPVPPELRKTYVLDALDPARGEVRIVPELRRKVAFGQLNLIDRHYSVGDPFDLIFCRNVLIYFDKPTQEAVVNRLSARLRPGGYLFLGHSESISGFQHDLTSVAGTVFQRK